MRYAKLTENGIEFYKGKPSQAQEQGYLPVELTPKPDDYPRYASKFVEQDGKIVQVWERYPNHDEIRRLEALLDSDRYKLDKIIEYAHAGLPCPYTEEELAEYHARREAIREKIRVLKACEDE